MEKLTRLKYPVDVVYAIARAFDTSSTSTEKGIGDDRVLSGSEKQNTMPEINGTVRI